MERRIEGGVRHAERIEQPLLEKCVERLAADDFDDATDGVDAGLAVAPGRARFTCHGSGQIERNQVGQRADLGTIAGRFSETRRVRHQLRQRQVGGSTGGRLERGELGQVLGDRIGDLEFALVLQHEHGDAGDRFRHRSDPEHRVGLQRGGGRDIGQTGGLKMQYRVLGHHDGDRAGDDLLIDGPLHGRAYPRQLGWCTAGDNDKGQGGKRQAEGKDHGETGETVGTYQLGLPVSETNTIFGTARARRGRSF